MFLALGTLLAWLITIAELLMMVFDFTAELVDSPRPAFIVIMVVIRLSAWSWIKSPLLVIILTPVLMPQLKSRNRSDLFLVSLLIINVNRLTLTPPIGNVSLNVISGCRKLKFVWMQSESAFPQPGFFPIPLLIVVLRFAPIHHPPLKF